MILKTAQGTQGVGVIFIDSRKTLLATMQLINKIDEDHSDITSSVREYILDQGEDTLTFLGNYIEQIDTDLDRQQLKTLSINYTKRL